MPARGLPGNANLQQLTEGAESFQRAVRAGDVGAADVVREFHPRLGNVTAGSPELTGFSLADAELVIARSFNFPSWPTLETYLQTTANYSRSPHAQPIGDPIANEHELIDEFLRLACLNYGQDDPARWRRARELLEANPQLAGASIHTAAAVGEIAAARELLERDPSLAGLEGGPHEWEPLLYLTYSRLDAPGPGRSAVEVARMLLGHGADPNAGYLWEGLSPPFTALTGAFGAGEQGAPAHAASIALARLLLEAGADPNDAQALYNRSWVAGDEWLELLFEFGLGTGDGGRWHRLLAPAHATPTEMLQDLLMAAASENFVNRARMLLAHDVDPDGRGTQHPIYKGRTPPQEAALCGSAGVAELLRKAGAKSALDPVYSLITACMEGDRRRVERMVAEDQALSERARAEHPEQLVRAAEKASLGAVKLLIELGFDVNGIHGVHRGAPLHEAAMRGNLDIIELLLEHGADPNLRDRSYDATPAGWAEHFGQHEAGQYLRRMERA